MTGRDHLVAMPQFIATVDPCHSRHDDTRPP
jgi:hypothetical protein